MRPRPTDGKEEALFVGRVPWPAADAHVGPAEDARSRPTGSGFNGAFLTVTVLNMRSVARIPFRISENGAGISISRCARIRGMAAVVSDDKNTESNPPGKSWFIRIVRPYMWRRSIQKTVIQLLAASACLQSSLLGHTED